MFKRKCYDELLRWKNTSKGRSAIMIEGARRVGKTTIAKQLAKNEYADSIYIDFSVAPKELLDIFRDHRSDVNTFLRLLQLQMGKRLPERNALVIFDEVQRFPMAREYVKHLVEDGRFDYLETGSLISIKKNVGDIVIPSEEDKVVLNPLDFEEYLWAIDTEMLAEEIRSCRNELMPLPDSLHRKCSQLFNEYMIVGGMPQPVSAFLETHDFVEPEIEKRRILNLYFEDIAKFGGADARRARAIFENVPGQLSANSKRFKFSSLGSGVRYGDCESAIFWLKDAHLINPCHNSADPNLGYKLTEVESDVKCYMADTGLLVSLAFDDGPEALSVQRALQFGRVSVNKGMIVENAIAQQLKSSGHSLFYHAWNEPNPNAGGRPLPREIDFLVTKPYANAAGKPRVNPIEVKSSKNYTTISLDDFARKHIGRIGKQTVLHPKQLSVEGEREYLPLYMSFCL